METEAGFGLWYDAEPVRSDPQLYEQLRQWGRDWAGAGERQSPATGPGLLAAVTHPVELVASIGRAESTLAALSLFRQVLLMMGVDSGVFVSRIRDDALGTSYRALLSCDLRWAAMYRDPCWHDRCPWFRHARENDEPIRDTELALLRGEEAYAGQMRELGFSTSVIVPSPSNMGSSRMGVLCVGSRHAGFFEGAGYDSVTVVLQGLAMQLHRWALKTMRAEWLARSGITADELGLLRHEVAGHSSQWIAAALNVSPRTIDGRFHRLMAKLHVDDRRTAARLVRLYGLV